MTIGSGDSDFPANDFESFRRQELLFALLNTLLIGALLALQEIRDSFAGDRRKPSLWFWRLVSWSRRLT